jgi:hypothetical protein
VGEAATVVVVTAAAAAAAGVINDAPLAVCDWYFRMIIPAAF